jgi:hypothetical protein
LAFAPRFENKATRGDQDFGAVPKIAAFPATFPRRKESKDFGERKRFHYPAKI